MAAKFIKKIDGNCYLRLTGSTTTVSFGGVSGAGNTYSFLVNDGVNNVTVLSKNVSDPPNTIYYTGLTSTIDIFPIPTIGTVIKDNSRFTGETVRRTYTRTGSIDDYSLSFITSDPANPPKFYLGGESLDWGSNLYAYPGTGSDVIVTAKGIGVKKNGVWKNSGNIFINQGGEWKECAKAWVKSGGVWKRMYQNYGNSTWINLLEGVDDSIDFAIQVYAYD